MYLNIIFLPFFGSLFVLFLGRCLGSKGSAFVSTLCVGISFLFSVIAFFEVALAGSVCFVKLIPWFNSELFNTDWGLSFDSLTVTMLVVVTFISSLVHLYSIEYMSHDPHLPRFMAFLSLFTAFMLVLVTGDNFIQMFLGWEGMNGKFVTCFKSRMLFETFAVFFKTELFKNINTLAIKALYLNTHFFLMLGGTIVLLVCELYHSVRPQIKNFSGLITCRGKPRFVLKGCNSNALIQSCIITRLNYKVKTHSICATSLFTTKNIAPKKQVEKCFLNKTNLGKPFYVKKPIASYSFTLLKLRSECNGVSPACSLVESFSKIKMWSRELSVAVEGESESLKRSILKDLKGGKWPTDCNIKRRVIANYIQNVQNQIMVCQREQQLDLLALHVFDIRNRIFAIDCIFNMFKNGNSGRRCYSDSNSKIQKFGLLGQTKLSNLSKLPECKIVRVETPKVSRGKRLVEVCLPIDNVLQCMFLNFLDVIIEELLKPEIFAYRKGRDARMAVSCVYSKLNRAKYLKRVCLCSVDIKKCFDNIIHQRIIEQYPFPPKYKFLFLRWLTPTIIDKSRNFKSLGKISRGVPQGSILGPSIANLMLSSSFPKNIFKGKGRKKVWAEFFSYSDNAILIANDTQAFHNYLHRLILKIKTIGLSLNIGKAKSFVNTGNKIKMRFQFLGFELIIVPRNCIKKGSLFSNMKNLSAIKKGVKEFAIILRPSPEKFKGIKNSLKMVIKQILHHPRNQIYKSFEFINFILLGWGSYYYFNQGCIYGRRIDNFAFKYLRKTLVKKFRYNGLLRPRWVSHNFLGLGKVNPNGKAWQPIALKYAKCSLKVAKHVYVWFCGDIFSRLSITAFLLNPRLRRKNYYAYRKDSKKNLANLISKRLKAHLKIKLYGEH